MDMLAQYEADEASLDGRTRRPKGPAPLTAMPCSSNNNPQEDRDSEGQHAARSVMKVIEANNHATFLTIATEGRMHRSIIYGRIAQWWGSEC